MAWVVDEQVRINREIALRALARAQDQCSYALGRRPLLESGTRAAVGTGHREGDVLVGALLAGFDGLSRASAAMERASSCTIGVDIHHWVDDPPASGTGGQAYG